ncbi:Transcriptional activator protein LasR [Pandoraea terrae]|uniref:Transcriptional activator protein LasR n=1 Tax=Pandoraea terrae TaxID=1537710 RepID=A0A5E4Z462_9BURK|nr:LuxR family transcriptional regulator [Pandoraea terrae]VVE55507.1 Transcriptional activator protein LasR [Pandoraea terrae]
MASGALTFCHWLRHLELAAQRDVESWFAALTTLSRGFGFQHTAFAVLPRQGTCEQATFACSTYPSDWRRRYRECDFAQIDPLVAHAREHAVPLVWTSRQYAGPEQRALYAEACRHGLRTGVLLPMHGPGLSPGMLCLATRECAQPRVLARLTQTLPSLALLRDAAQESGRCFVEQHANEAAPRLTPRERECVTWVAHGKSTWEISRICGCSEATVNFHMGNVRRKFGVTSRNVAALKAATMGMLELP